MFRDIAPDLYAIEGPFQFFGLDMGARMSIVKRLNGELWVYAPFAVSSEEEAAIRAKGEVRDIVVPNAFHTTEVGEFARRFPGATVWALAELKSKLENVPHQTLESWPDQWRQDFDALLFDGAKFREWAVCHRASRSLLITDLGFHLPRQSKPLGRLVARLNGIGPRFGPSRFERILMWLGSRARARTQLRALQKLDFARIVPGHGFVVERDAKKQFRAAYRFLRV